MLLLLLLRPQKGRRRRASPLLLSAALLCFFPVSTGLPATHKCPPPSHCKREGRLNCRRSSSHCGPCFASLVENKEGRCVGREELRPHGQSTFFSDPDEEIDFLQSVIAKQEVTELRPVTNPAGAPRRNHANKSRTDVSLLALKSQSRDALHANTAAPPTDTSTPPPRATNAVGRVGPNVSPTIREDHLLIIIISVCVVVGVTAVIIGTVCCVQLQKGSRLAQKVDYPSFGGVGAPAATAGGTSMGDKTLAQSAQMYHYQHRKQQMLSVGHHKPEHNAHEPEITSDEEEVGGDFTVYECPGLAPTGEMEVKNPLFDDSNLHYQGNHK
ncbi:neural proliferation differentiation and control protein 1-like isoform X1 [Takifugu flavidus]|uniref:neural proliferation differentiation and control protein 1-like isoform X1 n=1 Tax=Takifugu flavidus TaxID=433684 RepID=UPI00254490E7|nr:neural proliferation differentiation and control protein 1-like isoform X1 [Takifugu flavidus]